MSVMVIGLVLSKSSLVAGDLETLYEGTSHWAAFLQTWYQVLAPGLHTLGWDPVAGESEENISTVEHPNATGDEFG